jgi:hypothetical protein
MKKSIFILILVMISTNIFSQEYSKVLIIEGVTPERSYQLTKEWIALTYNSAQDVLQLDTPTKVILKGKLNLPTKMYGMAYSWIIDHTLTIAFREGRFKMDIEVGQFSHSSYPQMAFPLPDYYLQKVDKETYFVEMWEDQNVRNAGPKLRERTEKQYGDQLYSQYLEDYQKYNFTIENLFNSLQSYILENSEENW